jgi:hypothetical protein
MIWLHLSKKMAFQIVIASQETAGITADVPAIDSDVGIWKLIREYTQVYESKTHRIPVQYIERDFYRFFHLAGTIIINYIYQLFGLLK